VLELETTMGNHFALIAAAVCHYRMGRCVACAVEQVASILLATLLCVRSGKCKHSTTEDLVCMVAST
jgi:hypothetical protein